MHNDDIQYSTTERNRLSDRDMLLDLLTYVKGMSHFYDHAIMEAAHAKVRNTFEKLQHHKHETARALFDSMQNHGWYGSRNDQQTTRQQDYDLSAVHTDEEVELRPKSGIGLRAEDFAKRPDSRYGSMNATADFGHRLGRRTVTGSIRGSRSRAARNTQLTM